MENYKFIFEMGGSCNTNGAMRILYKISVGKYDMKEKANSEDLGAVGMIRGS
jgi:hypothetical protein